MRRGQRTGSMASTEVASSSRMLSHISFRFRLLTSSPPPFCWASGLVGGSDGLSSSHGSAHSLRITYDSFVTYHMYDVDLKLIVLNLCYFQEI